MLSNIIPPTPPLEKGGNWKRKTFFFLVPKLNLGTQLGSKLSLDLSKRSLSQLRNEIIMVAAGFSLRRLKPAATN